MAEAAGVRAQTLRQLRAKTPEQLREKLHAWHEWPTWRWIVHLSVEHYDEHFPDLRRFAGA